MSEQPGKTESPIPPLVVPNVNTADTSKSKAGSTTESKHEKGRDQKYDPFIIEAVFPSPELILSVVHPPLREVLSTCLFVLDANTMLAPFLVGKDSLADVAVVFTKLVGDGRLFLPSQAVREYARHRASKIAEAFGHVQQRMSDIPAGPKNIEISMFEDVEAYKKVVESANALKSAIKDYKNKLQALQEEVRDWHWNDPVSKLYAAIFNGSHVVDHGMSKEELSADLAHRVLHEIPPGFKDKMKLDGGIGDVAIWHSILKLGTDRNANVIFVTNDGKPDWMVRYGDEPLYPRFELVEEFRQRTGREFSILRFTRFLKLMGAETTTVNEVAATSSSSASSSSTQGGVSGWAEGEWGELGLSWHGPMATTLRRLREVLELAGDPSINFFTDERLPTAINDFFSDSDALYSEMTSVPTSAETLHKFQMLHAEAANRLSAVRADYDALQRSITRAEEHDAAHRLARNAVRSLNALGAFHAHLRQIR